jgi:hypothetical protein
MTDRDTSNKPAPLLQGSEFAKSIFPPFNINVPMPADTAVPGSYNKPAQQSVPAPPKSAATSLLKAPSPAPTKPKESK